MGAEFSLRGPEIGGADTVRPGRDAQIDSDADAAAGTVGPADLVIAKALLVRDRIAFFPRHLSRLLWSDNPFLLVTPRRRGSRFAPGKEQGAAVDTLDLWIPAFAGMTKYVVQWRASCSVRRELFEAPARHFLTARKPHSGQALHPGDQPVHHRDPQCPAGDEWMHADVEVAALAVLLAERRPPDVEHMFRVGNALCGILAAEPSKAEEHRVVDHIVKRQMDEAIVAALVDDVMRELIGRALGTVDISVLAQQGCAVPTTSSDGS